MGKLEDLAVANTIPKVSVFTTDKGFEEFTVKDIKQSILRHSTMEQAVAEVLKDLYIWIF